MPEESSTLPRSSFDENYVAAQDFESVEETTQGPGTPKSPSLPGRNHVSLIVYLTSIINFLLIFFMTRCREIGKRFKRTSWNDF